MHFSLPIIVHFKTDSVLFRVKKENYNENGLYIYNIIWTFQTRCSMTALNEVLSITKDNRRLSYLLPKYLISFMEYFVKSE